MNVLPPRQILATLLPYLRIAAAYANRIQSQITALPEKDEGNNFFAAALTDADLSVQNLVEVSLLGTFPHLRFYGEEYEKSGNTKYFRSIELGSQDDYLITLDPIDGTRFYLDGHDNYQIILSILNADDFEAVMAISPAQNVYYYALRGEGAYQGSLESDLDNCSAIAISNPKPVVLLGWDMGFLKPALSEKYQVIDVAKDYDSKVKIPNVNGIFTSQEITGTIIRRGKFIDGGALAFLAREAGCIVTTLDGKSPPPLSECQDYSLPGLIVASSASVHQDLLAAYQSIVVSS